MTACLPIDPPNDPPEIEPTERDRLEARDELADSDLLADYLAEIADQIAPALYRGGDEAAAAAEAFRDRARARFSDWLDARAQKIAEARDAREREEDAQNQADARMFDHE